jgi:hypothetical protein
MASENPQPPAGTRLPVFPVACWLLGLMGFAELLVAGMALAMRLEESRQVRIVEKEVPKPMVIRVPAPSPDEPSVVSRPPVPPVTTLPPTAASTPAAPTTTPPLAPPLPAPTPLNTPPIADPRTERLVQEAREARVAGDMGRAVMKLEEAQTQSPDDPNVHYELGAVHEQMGVFDTAASHYEKVFQLGISGAGSLYELAAGKLREGFEQPEAMLGKLSLGRVRIFNNPNHEGGQQVILTVPVLKAPGEEVEISEIAVAVTFFNKNNKGDIIQLEDNSWVTGRDNWVTGDFDWSGGEEDLRMTYTIPRQDTQTEHLFGGRTYYGQVVTLSYKGEVLDVQAWPRDLAARTAQQPATGQGLPISPEFEDSLPPDFNLADPLLPALPTE